MCGCLGVVCFSGGKKANVAVVSLSPRKLQQTSHQLLTSEAGRSLVDHRSNPKIKENSSKQATLLKGTPQFAPFLWLSVFCCNMTSAEQKIGQDCYLFCTLLIKGKKCDFSKWDWRELSVDRCPRPPTQPSKGKQFDSRLSHVSHLRKRILMFSAKLKLV